MASVCVLALAGCSGGSGSTVEPAVSYHHIDVDGASRRYRLYTPPALDDDRPMPLLLALHGSGNTPEDLVDSTRLDQAADAGRFVVAYPEAVRLLWNGGFCCTFGRGDPATDVRFLDQLITEVSAVRKIDTARVYAAGVSAGGIMAYRLACDLAHRLAGVAAIAGGMQLDGCQPSRPVSVLAIHGTGDDVVPYEGGRVNGAANRPVPPAMAVVGQWAAFDTCAGEAEARREGIVTTTTWGRCEAGTSVRLVAVEGGGHSWFDKDYGLPNGAISATASIVEFFGLT